MSEKNRRNTPMSKEQLDRTDEILSHVRSIDAQMTWVIRSEEKELKKLLIEYFKRRKRSSKVYLAVDGNRSTGQIAEYLGLHGQAVTNELRELANRGLIELKRWGVYKKSKIDSILRLSSELRRDSVLENIK